MIRLSLKLSIFKASVQLYRLKVGCYGLDVPVKYVLVQPWWYVITDFGHTSLPESQRDLRDISEVWYPDLLNAPVLNQDAAYRWFPYRVPAIYLSMGEIGRTIVSYIHLIICDLGHQL